MSPAIGRLALAVCTISLGGCAASPLNEMVKDQFPGYEARQPASSESGLGRRVIGSSTGANQCFVGQETSVHEDRSWQSGSLDYASTRAAEFTADFGTLLKTQGERRSEATIRLRLEQMVKTELDDVAFDPASACAADDALRAGYQSASGRSERVITKALKAHKVRIEEGLDERTEVQLEIRSRTLGPSEKTKTTALWEGVDLYFAEYAQRVRVTMRVAPKCVLTHGSSETCDLGPCGLRLEVVEAGTWDGVLSCQSGASHRFEKRPLGDWSAALLGRGVSYGVRLSDVDAPGKKRVEMVKWIVVATD